MFIIVTIECIFALAALIYLIGLTIVWIWEFRKNALYAKRQQNLKMLEFLPKSAAVLHAKAYKIGKDYRNDLQRLEDVQFFILENILMLRKSTLKTKYKL